MQSKCVEIKNDGKQCTRDATKPGILCTQHYNLKNKLKTAGEKEEEEPWVKVGLPTPSPLLGSKFIKKIRTKLKKGIKPTDGEGFIYIYYLEKEKGEDKWKIGRTNRNVDERMAEWTEEHKQKVVLHKSYKVAKGVDLTERLIHLYLKCYNIHRYPNTDGTFCDKYSLSGEIVPGSKIKQPEAITKKHIEWFFCEIQKIKPVIQSIVNYANKQ